MLSNGVGIRGQRLSGLAEGSQAPRLGEEVTQAFLWARFHGALIHRERADAAREAERGEIGSGLGAACERAGTVRPKCLESFALGERD